MSFYSDSTPSEAVCVGRRVLELETHALSVLGSALLTTLSAPFTSAIDVLFHVTGRVIVTGMGKSGLIAQKIAATFSSTGTPTHYVHPADASHGDLGMIASGDVILALSWSGQTAELADLIFYAKASRIFLIGITSEPGSLLARDADLALVLPQVEEACANTRAPTVSTTTQLAFGDALAVALMKRKGFSIDDFHRFHPGGKLGAQMLFVQDLMHKGDKAPLISAESKMEEAILTMTSYGFGCVGVVNALGKLVGIITDGDLRCHMNPLLLSQNVSSVMTREPRVVTGRTRAVEALTLLNRHRITALFVVEGDFPVGIVHTHDFFRLALTTRD